MPLPRNHADRHPIASGDNQAVAVIGVVFLGEHLSVQGWTGIALIAGGAALVALG